MLLKSLAEICVLKTLLKWLAKLTGFFTIFYFFLHFKCTIIYSICQFRKEDQIE